MCPPLHRVDVPATTPRRCVRPYAVEVSCGDESGTSSAATGASADASDRSGLGWYRGDCHVHSLVSNGGELTLEQLVAGARAVTLDFLAITDHNTAETHAACSGHVDQELLVILGQEVTTQTGHWLALGVAPGQVVDWNYGVRDNEVGRWLHEVHRVGGLCVAAHPYAPYQSGTFMYPYQGFDLVEVWNGPWTSDVPWQADNEAALAEWGRGLTADVGHGRWRPAIGNSDTHLEGQIGIPHTVVLADEFSADAILAGLRAGRSWIVESRAVEFSFTISTGQQGATIGERLASGDEPVAARVEVRGVPAGIVTFVTQEGPVYRASLSDAGSGTVAWHTSAEATTFIRIEVRDRNGHMAALSNPIILT